MTVVSVKKNKKNITISSDSQVTSWQMISYTNKVSRVWSIIFWWAWYLNELQIMERFLKEKWYDEKTIKSESELFTLFWTFYKYLEEKWVIDSRENWEKTVFNSFIVIMENIWKVYEYSYWSLIEIEKHGSIWSWRTVANTVMEMWWDTELAVQKAIDMTVYCGWKINTLIIPIKW